MTTGPEGWSAVFGGASVPAALLAFFAAILKGPTLLRLLTREWKQEAQEERRDLDSERDKIADWKDRELARLRDEVEKLKAKIEKLIGRVRQLMRSLDWWHDHARDERHNRLNDRQLHVAHEVRGKIDPLLLPDIPRVPAISEQSDAAEYEE